MSDIRYVEADGRKIYFLADDFGQVWLGGWFSLETAEERLRQAQECGWTPEEMDCSVEVDVEAVIK